MTRSDLKRDVTTLFFSSLIHTKGYLLTKPFYAGIGHILAFHRVCPRRKGERLSKNLWLEVTPEFLEETITFFAQRQYEAISLDQLRERLYHSVQPAKKFVVFTFDDGYVDNFTYAYPIFKRHQTPFTIYVTTNFPDRSAVLWWYLLEDLLLKEGRITISPENQSFTFACGTKAEKENTFTQLRTFIIGSHAQNTLSRIHAIFDPYHIDIYAKTDQLALNWEQIRQLSADPLVTIGAHTINHYALCQLPESEATTEIRESKQSIEAQINAPVSHFSYPFGTRDEAGARECQIVKACGFKTGTTTRPGNIFPNHKHYLECLPRNILSTERGQKDIRYWHLWINGMIPCLKNKFKRVVTL